jgi:hypothetical protein
MLGLFFFLEIMQNHIRDLKIARPIESKMQGLIFQPESLSRTI